MRRLASIAAVILAAGVAAGQGVMPGLLAWIETQTVAAPTNPISYWGMRTSGTTVYDDAGSNPGGASNGVWFSTANGVRGDGADFVAASNQYIRIEDAANLSFGNGSSDSAFSISAWVNMDDCTKFRILSKIGANAEYVFGFDSDDKLRIGLFDSNTLHSIYKVSTNVYTSLQGTWTHVVSTYTGGGINGIILYINGLPIAVTNVTTGTYVTMENTAEPVSIGGYTAGAGSYSDGRIDEVYLYGRVLTTNEVYQLYLRDAP